MKTGTKSLLFGIHQVFIHPVVVRKAWVYLYGKPSVKIVSENVTNFNCTPFMHQPVTN